MRFDDLSAHIVCVTVAVGDWLLLFIFAKLLKLLFRILLALSLSIRLKLVHPEQHDRGQL
jgi:hypothetical protein